MINTDQNRNKTEADEKAVFSRSYMKEEVKAMEKKAAVAANRFEAQREMYRNLFCAQIRNRKFVPGRENFNEAQEKERERAEFESIDDYVEQA